MKFVFMLEENGYEFRYWDEDNSDVGDTLLSNWDVGEFHETLKFMGFHIKKQEIMKALSVLKGRPFVIFSSKSEKGPDSLHYDWFEVEA